MRETFGKSIPRPNGPPSVSQPSTQRGGKVKNANEAALRYVSQRLQHGQFTGQIVLHVNGGTIRKTETRDFVTTEELLTGQGSTG